MNLPYVRPQLFNPGHRDGGKEEQPIMVQTRPSSLAEMPSLPLNLASIMMDTLGFHHLDCRWANRSLLWFKHDFLPLLFPLVNINPDIQHMFIIPHMLLLKDHLITSMLLLKDHLIPPMLLLNVMLTQLHRDMHKHPTPPKQRDRGCCRL